MTLQRFVVNRKNQRHNNRSSTITPYEERYRKIYEAGGDRFYPRVPSKEFISFLDQRRLKPGIALIAGCGEGRNIEPLVLRGWSVIGIDSAPSGLARGAKDYAGDEKVSLIQADLLSPLQLPCSLMDLIVVIGIVHLFVAEEDRKKLFKHLYQIAKPGAFIFLENNGRLNAHDVTYEPAIAGEKRMIQTPKGERKISLDRFPTVVLNGQKLRQELEEAGFHIESMKAGLFQHPDTVREQIVVFAQRRIL